MATKTVGHILAGSLIWALRRAGVAELCRLTVLFWESPHIQNFRRRVMMELEALCVRVALIASCSLHKSMKTEHSKSYSFVPRAWETTFDRRRPLDGPLLHLPRAACSWRWVPASASFLSWVRRLGKVPRRLPRQSL